MNQSPLVPLFNNKTVPSWPKYRCGRECQYAPISSVLISPYATDAHFAQYELPALPRRLGLGAVRQLPSGVPMVILAFDVDCVRAHEAKIPASDAWWSAECKKLGRISSQYGQCFIARSRGGYRAVFRLAVPFVVLSDEDAEAWKSFYLRAGCRLATAGIIIDPQCAPWVQLFRAPHATRDPALGPEALETIGDATRIAFWPNEDSDPSGDARIAARVAETSPAWVPVARRLAQASTRTRPVPAERPRVPVHGSRYARAALQRAARRVAEAKPTTRNETLNSEAFSVARLIRRGGLRREDVEAVLARAARQAGLGDREIASTLESALTARLVAR